MTSNNSIDYLIFDSSGKNVGSHRQNMMCKRCNDGLEKYKPLENHTIAECDEYYWMNGWQKIKQSLLTDILKKGIKLKFGL